MSFHQIIEQWRTPASTKQCTIDRAQYEAWSQHAILDALRGIKYGQSFCNYFDITDARLWHDWDWRRCDSLIRREYLDQ